MSARQALVAWRMAGSLFPNIHIAASVQLAPRRNARQAKGGQLCGFREQRRSMMFSSHRVYTCGDWA